LRGTAGEQTRTRKGGVRKPGHGVKGGQGQNEARLIDRDDSQRRGEILKQLKRGGSQGGETTTKEGFFNRKKRKN